MPPERRMADAAYMTLLRDLGDLIDAFEGHPDPATRERAVALLGGLDALHREGLERLVSGLEEVAGESVLDRLTEDPVVRTLLGLYDLAELDLPPEPEPPRRGGSVGFVPLEAVKVKVKRSASADAEEGPGT